MESEEAALLAKALHAHASASDCVLPSGYRCVFQFLQDLLNAASQVVLSKGAGLDDAQIRAIKKRFSIRVSGEFPQGPWTLDHLVNLLRDAGFITSAATKEVHVFIDSQVCAEIRSKQLSQKSLTWTSGISKRPSFDATSWAAFSTSSSASASASDTTDSSVAIVPATVCQKQEAQLVQLSNLRKDDALQIANLALEQQDAHQLLALVNRLVTERDLTSKSRDYFRSRVAALRGQMADMKRAQNELKSGIVQFSKRRKLSSKRHRLTVHGGYKLALSRNLGHSGALAALQTLEADLSRQTCCSWEHMLSHSILASHHRFHHFANRALAGAPEAKHPDVFELHAFGGDATNSNLVQSSKVHTCVIRSAYIVPVSVDSDPGDDGAGQQEQYKILTRKCLADLQLLPESVTAAVIKEVYRKQFGSVGLNKAWMEKADAGEGGQQQHLTAYIMTTDMGPDQAKCARLMSEKLAKADREVFFHLACLLHQIHLIVRHSLSKFPAYFPNCAKIVNVWRSWGNNRKIKAAWTKMFGEESCKHAASSLPPRPLRGRWGSIEGIEQYLLRCGRECLAQVYESALLKKAKSCIDEFGDCVVDDLEDETRKYQLQVGRWTLEAIAALRDDSFWGALIIGSKSRGPICHAMAYIMKQNKVNSEQDERHFTIVNFVSSLVPRALLEFDFLLASPEPWLDLHELSEPGDFALFNKATFATLLCCADFQRRIVARANSFPLKLAWLLHQPDTTSTKRMDVAAEVLNIADRVVSADVCLPANLPASRMMELLTEQHVAKIGIHFSEELRYARDTGLLRLRLQTFFQSFFNIMSLDTQSVEGLNSTIKLMCKAAPNLHLPLCSSRLNIKNHFRPYANSIIDRNKMIDSAAEDHQLTQEWITDSGLKPERWDFNFNAVSGELEDEGLPLQDQPSPVAKKPAVRYVIDGPTARAKPAKSKTEKSQATEMCCAKMLVLLQAACRKHAFPMKPAEGICFCFYTVHLPTLTGQDDDDDLSLTLSKVAYIGVVSMQRYSKSFWVRCALMSETVGRPNLDQETLVEIVKPMNHSDSLAVMNLLHDLATEDPSELLRVDVEVWHVQWGHEGCIGQGKVVRKTDLECNLAFACKCCGKLRGGRKQKKEIHRTTATDDEIINALAEELLAGAHRRDDDDEDEREPEGSDAHGDESCNNLDPDIQNLLEQAAPVCRP
eukprot:Skav231731  [mRNA]  locus=scaffold638:10945:15691:+ [translate_table: standard]